MATPSTITVPVSIGDTIYKKCSKVVDCRYFGDEYAKEDGQPNCLQHEYDCSAECDGGHDCDAKFEYYTEKVIVNDSILAAFAHEVITGVPNEHASKQHLLTEEEAKDWEFKPYY